MFIIIDKGDEYQLVFFVLYFKGTMFISQGVIRAIIGFFQYVSCFTAPHVTDPDGTVDHTCDTMGPGAAGIVLLPLAGFVLQQVLVWLAFCMLSSSEDKGKSKLDKLEDVLEIRGTKVKGGYLAYFLYYDLVCFFVCLAAIGYVIGTRDDDDRMSWPVAHLLFAVQVVYGYLSMPFYIFTLPFVQTILTHSIPTGYDMQGVCRKLRKPRGVSARAKRLEEEAKRSSTPVQDEIGKRKAALQELMNSEELQGRIKAITSKIAGGLGRGSASGSSHPTPPPSDP